MLYLTCTMISSVDLAHYGVSLAKEWESVDYGTIHQNDADKMVSFVTTRLSYNVLYSMSI